MPTNQGDQQEFFRGISGTSTVYNGDALAAFQAQGATENEYDGAFIEWLQIRTGSSKTNVNDLMAEFAEQYGFDGWDSVNELSFTKKVQRVTITISAGNLTGTATINAVDTTKTGIILAGLRISANASRNSVLSTLELTNSTTVTATRGSTTVEATIEAIVIEYSSLLVDSVQSGIINVTGTTNTATITSIDTARSIVHTAGSTASADNTTTNHAKVDLTNATTVTATRGSSTATADVSFIVLEFKSGIINTINNVDVVIAVLTSSKTETITAVNMARTQLFLRGCVFGDNFNFDINYPKVSLNSTTEIVATTQVATTTNTPEINVAVVEFNALIIRSGQSSIKLQVCYFSFICINRCNRIVSSCTASSNCNSSPLYASNN